MSGTPLRKSLLVGAIAAASILGFVAPPALAANVCDPSIGTDCAKVDGTPDAMRVTEYDSRGNYRGQKATCSAGLTIRTATAAGTEPFFTICGSATKTLRVQRFYLSGSVATAAVRGDVILKKTSTSTSDGTPTALTQTPHDSSSPACTANLANYYTVLATPGTAVGVIGSRFGNLPITATIVATDNLADFLWEFPDGAEVEAVVLRGTAQCLEANFGTTTTNAPTLLLYVKWTEE